MGPHVRFKFLRAARIRLHGDRCCDADGIYFVGLYASVAAATMAATAMVAAGAATAAAHPRALLMVAKPTAAPSWGASRGMSISSTTTARSWNSSTLKVARPWRDPVSALSASTCPPHSHPPLFQRGRTSFAGYVRKCMRFLGFTPRGSALDQLIVVARCG